MAVREHSWVVRFLREHGADLGPLGQLQRVVDVDPEMAHGAFHSDLSQEQFRSRPGERSATLWKWRPQGKCQQAKKLPMVRWKLALGMSSPVSASLLSRSAPKVIVGGQNWISTRKTKPAEAGFVVRLFRSLSLTTALLPEELKPSGAVFYANEGCQIPARSPSALSRRRREP